MPSYLTNYYPNKESSSNKKKWFSLFSRKLNSKSTMMMKMTKIILTIIKDKQVIYKQTKFRPKQRKRHKVHKTNNLDNLL